MSDALQRLRNKVLGTQEQVQIPNNVETGIGAPEPLPFATAPTDATNVNQMQPIRGLPGTIDQGEAIEPGLGKRIRYSGLEGPLHALDAIAQIPRAFGNVADAMGKSNPAMPVPFEHQRDPRDTKGMESLQKMGSALSDFLSEQVKKIPSPTTKKEKETLGVPSENLAIRLAQGTVEAIPLMSAFIGATLTHPVLGSAMMFGVEGGQAAQGMDEFEKQTGEKLDPRTKALTTFAVGGINSALEATGIGKLIKALKVEKGKFVAGLVASGVEGATEFAQEWTQILAEAGYTADAGQIHKEFWKALSDVENWKRAGEAGAIGMILGSAPIVQGGANTLADFAQKKTMPDNRLKFNAIQKEALKRGISIDVNGKKLSDNVVREMIRQHKKMSPLEQAKTSPKLNEAINKSPEELTVPEKNLLLERMDWLVREKGYTPEVFGQIGVAGVQEVLREGTRVRDVKKAIKRGKFAQKAEEVPDVIQTEKKPEKTTVPIQKDVKKVVTPEGSKPSKPSVADEAGKSPIVLPKLKTTEDADAFAATIKDEDVPALKEMLIEQELKKAKVRKSLKDMSRKEKLDFFSKNKTGNNYLREALEQKIGKSLKFDPKTNTFVEGEKPQAGVVPQKDFSKTKIVDKEGKPRTVFHGSDVEIDRFDIGKVKKWNKFGHIFTSKKDFADMFGDKTTKATINIQNPKVISTAKWNDIRDDHAKDPEWFANWKKELQSQGFDGLQIKGSKEEFAGETVENPEIIAVFDDAQVDVKPKEPDQFREATKMVEDNIEDVLRKQFPSAEIEIDTFKDRVNLSKIIIPKDERGTGIGTKAMERLIDWADKNGKKITLTPSKDFGASSVGRLKKFYKRFGFVENKGKNRDFSFKEDMFRDPVVEVEPVKKEQPKAPKEEAKAEPTPKKPTEEEVIKSRVFEKVKESFESEASVEVPKLKLEKDAKAAIKFAKDNPKKANLIAKGVLVNDTDLTDNNIATAVAEQAIEAKDFKTAAEVTARRSLALTRAGQEIVTERGRVGENSANTFVKQLISNRVNEATSVKDNLIGTISGNTKKEVIKRVERQAKIQSKRVRNKMTKISNAQKILDSIKCGV